MKKRRPSPARTVPKGLSGGPALADTEAGSIPEDSLDFQATSAAVLASLFGGDNRPKLGRYVVQRQIGQGAMGRVYAARDPTLDRDVALKVLAVNSGADARARLQVEAQALAQLNHPNVVQIFEVGTHDDEVFIAMEHVQGHNLRDWLTVTTRTTAERLAILVQAGDGLAAAHASEIVHRDFKPDNVMVDEAGRARVLDFGLARGTGAQADTDSQPDSPRHDGVTASMSLTRTGAILGSPAYMSPEQLSGAVASMRGDQFGFCVTAFEVLHGTRPFAGETATALLENIMSGKTVAVRDRTPGWIDDALRRGLSADPQMRWTSMDGLLTQLRRGGTRRGRWALAAVAVAVAAAAAATFADDDRSPLVACSDAALLTGVWDEPRRRAVVAALSDHGVAPERVASSLDTHAASWREAREDACGRGSTLSDGAGAQFDRSLACLERRRVELRGSVDVLLASTPSQARRAGEIVAGLRPPHACAQETRRTSYDEPSDPKRAALVRAELARASALRRAGAYDESSELASAQLASAATAATPHLEAEVRHAIALTHKSLGQHQEAASQAELAFFAAQRAQDDMLAVDIACLAIDILGWDSKDTAAAQRWVEHATALVRRLDSPPKLRALLLASRGRTRLAAGDHEAAVQLLSEALDLTGPTQTMLVARRRSDLGTALVDAGHLGAARAAYAGALAAFNELVGPLHPQVATAHDNAGSAAAMQGDFDAARKHFEAALAIHRETAPGSIAVARTVGNLGNLAQATGRYQDARPLLEQALKLFSETSGPEDSMVLASLGNLAANATRLKEYDRASQLLARSLRVQTDLLGDDHPDVGRVYSLLGNNELERGDGVQATQYFRFAVAIFERRLAPEHPQFSIPLSGLGRALAMTEDWDEAIVLLRRVLDLITQAGLNESEVAQAQLDLAEVLLSRQPGDKEGCGLILRPRAHYLRLDQAETVAQIDALRAACPHNPSE